MSTKITQKDYDIGELLSDTVNILQNHIRPIGIMVAIVYLPLNALIYFISSFAARVVPDIEPSFSMFHSMVGFSFGIGILGWLAGLIFTMAISYLTEKGIKKEDVDYHDALSHALKRLWPAVGTSILLGIFLIGLYLALIVPGIIFTIFWAFSISAVILRGKSGMEALNYSRSLVKNRWWRVFLILLLLAIMSGVASSILTQAFGSLVTYSVGFVIVTTLVSFISAFFTIAMTLFFINLDHTKDAVAKELEVHFEKKE